MTDDKTFYTATMARIQAKQGNIDRAIEIYQHLLEKEPGRADYVDALGDLEVLRADAAAKASQGMSTLKSTLGEYIRLLMHLKQLRDLKGIQNRLKD